MCACDSDSELVAFLRARHLWYSCCDQLESMEFGLLILLRGRHPETSNVKRCPMLSNVVKSNVKMSALTSTSLITIQYTSYTTIRI